MMARLQEIGAQLITLIGHSDTPLGHGGKPALVNFAADDTSSESFYIQALLVALSVMKARGEISEIQADGSPVRLLVIATNEELDD